MQRVREPIDELKAEIEQIVSDERLTVDQRITRIFQLRKPAEVSAEDVKREGLNFWLNRGEWAKLKTDREFWLDIIKRLGFVDVEAVNEMGNKLFSLPEIAQILGESMAYSMINTMSLFDLSTMDQQSFAKDQFMNYMLWYDETASMNYLVLYGRFLAIQGQLVPLESTREHRSSTSQPSLLVSTEPSTYNVVSNLTVVTGQTVRHSFFFYQQKSQDMPQPFVIQKGRDTKQISVSGPILRVLKFFYAVPAVGVQTRKDTVFVVLVGPDDNKLLRFSHLNIDDVLIVDKFIMNPDDFDDLVYANDREPYRFATNLKSSRTLEEMKVIDLSQFVKMMPQTIRRLSELTKEERRKLLAQREQNIARTTEGYLDIQTEYDYGKLFIRLAEPLSVRFKSGQVNYLVSQVELLAIKLIRVPLGGNAPTEYHVVALVRQYTNNQGAYKLQLRFYRYQTTDRGQFTSFASRIFDLQNFLSPNTELFTFRVEHINLIFHTPTVFYIEVMERRSDADQENFAFVNSQLLTFDFNYTAVIDQTPPPVLLDNKTLKDIALFEEIRTRRYKVYDYRHDITPLGFAKYDAIFYRYNATKAKGRVIFYKANLDTQPSVADRQFDDLKPGQIISFVALSKHPDLAFMSFKVVELQETLEGTFRMITLDAPVIVKLSVRDQLVTYTPDTLSLDTALIDNLSISSSKHLNCEFCSLRAKAKDDATGLLYCNTLCHHLSSYTHRL